MPEILLHVGKLYPANTSTKLKKKMVSVLKGCKSVLSFFLYFLLSIFTVQLGSFLTRNTRLGERWVNVKAKKNNNKKTENIKNKQTKNKTKKKGNALFIVEVRLAIGLVHRHSTFNNVKETI